MSSHVFHEIYLYINRHAACAVQSHRVAARIRRGQLRAVDVWLAIRLRQIALTMLALFPLIRPMI